MARAATFESIRAETVIWVIPALLVGSRSG
jgi:hypothetical protein